MKVRDVGGVSSKGGGTSAVPVGQRRILRTSKKATAPTLGRGRCYLRFLQT